MENALNSYRCNVWCISLHFQHDFIKKAEACEILIEMIREAKEIQEMQNQVLANGDESVRTACFLPFVNYHSCVCGVCVCVCERECECVCVCVCVSVCLCVCV